MGWVTKILKGSNHSGLHGQNQGFDGANVNMGGLANAQGRKDVNHAIAGPSSSSEVEQKKYISTKASSYLEEADLLARALKKSLNFETPHGSYPQHLPLPLPTRFREICAGCKSEIGNGRYLSCMGALWHPECFRCHACNLPVSDYEFSMHENHPYHKSCYRELRHPKCDVCLQFIPSNMSGLIDYRVHPFWKSKHCPSHDLDWTPHCCSCDRLETRGAKYVALDDGRKLCLECLNSAVMDTGECQPLYLEIRRFYEGLNMKIEQEIPLLLVARNALNEAREGSNHGYHHLPETRGICLAEVQTISTILRRPRFGAGNRIANISTEPYTVPRRCEVTAILVLYGLPRLLTGSILAHEMMHAWLRLNGYRNLRPEVEEGICEVLAHMWLDSEIMAGAGSNIASTSSSSWTSSSSSKKGVRSHFERKLGEFFKHQIESDPSPAYGDGFRAGNRAVLKYGLRRTLDHIYLTGSFPY